MKDMRNSYWLASVIVALLISRVVAVDQAKREPIIGGPCEGCEWVFEGMPTQLDWTARIAPSSERGEPMRLVGVVKDLKGRPAAGIIVYAYHTDAAGIYPAAGTRHGRLRGWAKTDASGRYRFDTIRPAGYPNSTIEQHVHMHIIEPGRSTYFIDDVWFTDDPRLPKDARNRSATARGGPGLVTPSRDKDGVLLVTRDIVLGLNIPGYR